MENRKNGSDGMGQNISIGVQSFEKIRENNYFYIDKTMFIKEWWEKGDDATLITRPRRFGKTLNMSMLEQFFSVEYKERGDLFEGLSIWEDEKYRKLQGTYPVISLSFANIKETNYEATCYRIRQLLMKQYQKNSFLLKSEIMSENEKKFFERMSYDMSQMDAPMAIYQLSDYLYRYYGKKVIILLDEYDTPMQEAYVLEFWDELVSFTRSLFNSTFKTNPYMIRGIMTGITRVSKESIFSDLNSLEIVTSTSDKYATSFGFTEEEVFSAMDSCGLEKPEQKELVKKWYDGFVLGKQKDIYNPWSIINYLSKKKVAPYWANTSSNSLIGKILKQGDKEVKSQFEQLLSGEYLVVELEEEVVFQQLTNKKNAIWSLLLASGYLKVVEVEEPNEYNQRRKSLYTLGITNLETEIMFADMVKGWFDEAGTDYNDFVKALLLGDLSAMNEYMNNVSEQIFSSFDTGKHPTKKQEPERFYHGFVLGLLVELQGKYRVTSNRESGFGRYDVMLEPLEASLDGIIIEFKVHKPKLENTLEDTVTAALQQIEEKKYETQLIKLGVPKEKIRKYGFGFSGKNVLIGEKMEK